MNLDLKDKMILLVALEILERVDIEHEYKPEDIVSLKSRIKS